MSVHESQSVMEGYFAALGTGDFARYFTDDVTWTTMQTGAQVSGPSAVQDYIVALHANMDDLRTTQLVITDEVTYLEGSCADAAGPGGRVGYCVAYDVVGSRIRAMRAYGALAAFSPVATRGRVPVG